MPNIARVLKEEIQRLARKEVRAELSRVRRDTVRLKKGVTALRREIAALSRTNSELMKKVSPVVAVKEAEEVAQKVATLRPTSSSLKRLRARLGLTQVQFGKLLGVTGQAVVQWAGREGRIRMRKQTLSRLATVQHIGKREARRQLEALGAVMASRKARR